MTALEMKNISTKNIDKFKSNNRTMKQIKFRAIVTGNKPSWIHGYYVESYGNSFIVTGFNKDNSEHYFHEVIPESVGQFVGLLDKNGKEIYEGDIIKVGYDEKYTLFVKWSRDHYELSNNEVDVISMQGPSTDAMRVIGNIHENPELLK